MQAAFANEFRATDAAVKVCAAEAQDDMLPMNAESTKKVLCMLTCLPNGIEAMSFEVEGLVQTSLNLGILNTAEDHVLASYCVRSAVETQKYMLVDRIESLMSMLGGTIEVRGDYPGWEYQPESKMRDLMVEVFTEQYGYAPKVEAIHAGVECGMFAGKIPGLECISFGPQLSDIHTFREHMSISSVQRTWKLVVETLKRMK